MAPTVPVMSRQIPPMPSEEDRHMMIYSQGNLEPEMPDPPSRSPSPELPPNFTPKPPVESTNFPAASNIISLLTRMSGGVSLRDLIVVPAATWDRNNTMWEHKMAQLRRKHRKDLAEKEIELRKKYDEQYSDARYREMLLSKEMKEMEFAQGVAGGEVLGKTWKEHKAAKKEMEKTYTEKLQENEKKLSESQSTIEKLRRELAEKEAAIEALQNAIGRRTDQVPTEETPQANPNILANLGPAITSAQQAFFQQPAQVSLAALQYALGQQQQQQQLADQSMALVRAGPFGGENNPGITGNQFSTPPAAGASFRAPSSIVPVFDSVSGPNVNPLHPAHQDQPHSQRAENRQDQGLGRRNDPRNSRGGNRNLNTNGHTRNDNHGGRRGGRNVTWDDKQRPTNPHLQVPHISGNHPGNHLGNRLERRPSFHLDVRPEIIHRERGLEGRSGNHVSSRSYHNEPRLKTNTSVDPLSNTIEGVSGQDAFFPTPAPPTVSSWNSPFATPQNRSIATKGPSQFALAPPPLLHSPSQSNIGSKMLHPNPSPDTKPTTPFGGFISPFGVAAGSPWSKPANDVSDTAMQGVDPEETKYSPGTLNTPNRQKTSGLPFVNANGSGGQKRPHSISPPSRRVAPRATQPQQEGEDNMAMDSDRFLSIVKARYPVGAVMTEEELDKAIDDTMAEYIKPIVAPPIEDDAISDVDLTHHEEETAAALVKATIGRKRIVCVSLKLDIPWLKPRYIVHKIRGGALEAIHVYEKDQEVYVNFINPDAAQAFFDFFNQEPNATEAFIRYKVTVRWVTDSISPLSLEMALLIASGATRCLRISKIADDKLLNEVKADFKTDKAPFHVLDVRIGTEEGRKRDHAGMGQFVVIEFCSIKASMDTKREIENNEMTGYQGCGVQFMHDPCQKNDGEPWFMDSLRTWP